MNLIQDHEAFLVLSEIEFWIRQFRPVRRQFQVKVDGAVFQLGSQRKGQRGFADLARPEKPNRGESSQEVLNNWLDRSLKVTRRHLYLLRSPLSSFAMRAEFWAHRPNLGCNIGCS